MSRIRLLLATGNPGKVREIRAALAGLPVVPVALTPEGLAAESGGEVPEEPEETGADFLANAGIKALYYHAATGLPALAEDSGLEVDALDGAPGVRSARWLGRDTPYSEKNRRLLELVGDGERSIRYRSAFALAAAGRILFRSSGVVEGRLAPAPRGSGGFGYDPVFELLESGRTMAELALEEKEAISHRGRAIRPLRPFLEAALSSGLLPPGE